MDAGRGASLFGEGARKGSSDKDRMLTERTLWLAATTVTIVLLVVMIISAAAGTTAYATYADFGDAHLCRGIDNGTEFGVMRITLR
jgi:hypothetical protein